MRLFRVPLPSFTRHGAWPVYAITVSMVALAIMLTTVIAVVPILAIAFYHVITGDLFLGDIGPYIQNLLGSVFAKPLNELVIGVLGNSLSFGIVALVLAHRGGRGVPATPEDRDRPWIRLRLDHGSIRDALLAIVGLIGLTMALDAVLVLFHLNQSGRLGDISRAVAPLGIGERMLLSIVLAFGAGTSEELYFRGYMLPKLELAQGRTLALIGSSLAFGAFHLDPIHTPIAALMGLYLGTAATISGSLWTSIAAHVANNMLAVIFAGSETSESGAALAIPIGLVLCAGSVALLRRRHPGEPRAPVW